MCIYYVKRVIHLPTVSRKKPCNVTCYSVSTNLVVLENYISVRLGIFAFMSSVKHVAESPLSKNGEQSVLFIGSDNQVRYETSEVLLRESEDVEDIEKIFLHPLRKS